MIKRAFLSGLLLTMFMTVAAYGYSLPQIHPIYDTEIQTTYMTTAPLNLRPTPCTSGDRLALVQPGHRVEVVDFRDGEWFQVNYNGQFGYMYAEFLMELPASGQHLITAPGTVELIQWSDARNIIPQNVPFTVVDARTGIRYQLISFSHGSHADVFPATAEDTEILRSTFGSWSWATRPIVIFIGDRALAASINGMPHGGVVESRNNNMAGHVCIHFQGSLTHNRSLNHERDHQNAVLEAFNTASNW